jgi:4-amino-4-deoxy-L-arabinose transferase-like glycosyltransferase
MIGVITSAKQVQDTPQPDRLHPLWPVAAFAAVLVAGTALRLWKLQTSPAWQWDEAVYWRVAANVQHGVLAEHPVFGAPWEPFLYQPPLYFLVVARWFGVVGASIYHARILGVVWTAVTQVLLFRLLWKLHGPRVALLAIIPLVFDGWLLYIERVSYIENALMLLVVATFLLYRCALERGDWRWFAAAGLAAGFTASFKQTGAYIIVAILLCWLIVRRDHRGHCALLGAAAGVIAAYLVAMTRMYDLPGRPWFTSQSLVQVRRVLGLQHSGGTLSSPGGALHLLEAQYRYFAFSAILAAAAVGLSAWKVWQCYRARNWAPAQANALLFSWLVTGVVVFGLSSLKFPQYFALILVPAYCYLWTELARWDWRGIVKYSAAAVAAVAGMVSFLLTIPAFTVNSLAAIQAYAARSIPPGAVVVTEQSIGDLIGQRWCTVERAQACVGVATYAITWRTYLQSSAAEGDASYHLLMRGAVPVASLAGPAGSATVWKLRRTS